MGVQDVIKKSILEGFNLDITMSEIVVTLGITILIAMYIFVIYRITSNGNFYSKDFNKTLAIISVITAAIVLAMQSNIVISLGMVGALSIVRFRNAVKNPLDLIFLFWSISVGIICGAGLYSIAVVTSIAVTILIFALDFVGTPKAPYLLVVNSSEKNIEEALMDVVDELARGTKIKSRNITMNGANYVIELSTRNEQELIEECSKINGVVNVSLLSHDGELRA